MTPAAIWSRLRRLVTPAAARAGIAVLGLLAGGVCHLAGAGGAGDVLWQVTIVVTVLPVTWEVARGMARGDFGVDIIALLAMVAALIGGELLAGAIVAVMLTGGDALEDYAAGRARRDLTALLRRAPQAARRRVRDGWEEIAVDAVEAGDLLLVRAGEVVPADGTLVSERAAIDASTVTGEPLPVDAAQGATVRSGTVNAGAPFELRATRGAADSSYAALVKLVQEAARERPPFTRMADRYAMIFLPVTLGLAGAAWALSGDQIRALAVLVVATPCPLILAAPIALVAGLSRAASSGIVLKGGGALEQLGTARTVLLDKTRTLTQGRPAVERIVTFDGHVAEHRRDGRRRVRLPAARRGRAAAGGDRHRRHPQRAASAAGLRCQAARRSRARCRRRRDPAAVSAHDPPTTIEASVSPSPSTIHLHAPSRTTRTGPGWAGVRYSISASIDGGSLSRNSSSSSGCQ